ncbi:MAG: DUF2330 domain-containing protein, partial [Archangium sp.]
MRALLLLGVVLCSLPAAAFCGFYVSGAGGQLFNDASMVVLVRDGTRTVLSMQNNYRGPVDDFALVVPVPALLTKENVKTIPREAFTRIDELTAPRLVEVPREDCAFGLGGIGTKGRGGGVGGYGSGAGLGVRVEAKFEVEEYEVVVLSAQDSLGLEIWLKEYKYKIPDGASELLRPYVQTGQKFFVARVDAKKAKFQNGQLVLSPLRFSYDSESFSLPVRLGLVNSGGSQDLIVNIVAKDRYELANLKNVFVPTNVELTSRAGPQFGGFYKELLARTFAKNPGTAVTEFAWRGALPSPDEQQQYGVTCDPCPPVNPVDKQLARFVGVDLLPNRQTDAEVSAFAKNATLTRLHLRYSKAGAPDDLVFKVAPPIRGGVPDATTAGPHETNRFQARFVMRSDGCERMTSTFDGSNALTTTLVDPLEEIVTTPIAALDVTPRKLSANRVLPHLPMPPRPLLPRMPVVAAQPRSTCELDEPRVSGQLAPAIVTKVVRRHLAEIRFCYEQQLAQ